MRNETEQNGHLDFHASIWLQKSIFDKYHHSCMEGKK